jgi:uncharacterized membrane protein
MEKFIMANIAISDIKVAGSALFTDLTEAELQVSGGGGHGGYGGGSGKNKGGSGKNKGGSGKNKGGYGGGYGGGCFPHH